MKYLDDYIQNDMKEISDSRLLSNINPTSSIMITGCNGMIATYLVYFFLYLNDQFDFHLQLYAITRSINKTKNKYNDIFDRKDIQFIEHDVNDVFPFSYGVDYLFHLASSADPRNILEKPVDIIKANTIGLLHALDFAKSVRVKKIAFSSTREVYGKLDDSCENVDESSLGIIDQLETRSCYPESKKMAECLLNAYSLQYHIPYTILRIAHSYGPGMPIQNDGRIMSDLMNNVVHNEDIILHSDGKMERGFLYLGDMISGMLYATFLGKDNQVFNLANEDENISVRDLAGLFIELFPEKNLHVQYQEISEKEKAAYCKFKRVKMNTDRLRALGWEPKIGLREGLLKTVKSYGGNGS